MTGTPRTRRWTVVAAAAWFALLAAFAIATRMPMVREGLWRDEAISVSIATAPSVSELLARNRVSDYNPPLFNLLLAGYTRLFGSEEIPLKLFALALGLLAAAGATALAWELGGPVAAALTAALTVNQPLLIEMSTETRAYSLSAFLAAISLLAAFRLRRRDPGARGFTVLWVLLTLLVYSHVAGGVVAAVLFFWGLFEWLRRPAWRFGRGLALAALAASGTYLLWLPTTWRQFRTGIPWETPLTPWEKVESLLRRSSEVLPIPGGLEQPLLLAGVASLLAVGVLRRPAVAARFRGRWEGLVIPSLAAAAVGIPLGLFSRHTRYLVIPALLAAVVFSVVAIRLADAGRETPGTLRAAAFAGLAALVVASFLARRDFYEARFSGAERPKSGIRTLCRDRPFTPDDFVLVLPDYLAPTVWYYCGRPQNLHGFARWNRPDLFDPGNHGEAWKDSTVPTAVLSQIDERIRDGGPRFLLIREWAPAGWLPFYEPRAGEFQAELQRRFDETSAGRFPARIEPVEAFVLKPR